MRNIAWAISAGCFLGALLSGCIAWFIPPPKKEPPPKILPHVNSPHENFQHFLKSKIGLKYDDPPNVTGIDKKQLISSNALLNGNFENGYSYRESCVYFFEINPDTQKIVKWRYTGSEQDCAVDR